MLSGRVFQQTVGIAMGTNCTPLLVELCLYLYESVLMQEVHMKTKNKLFSLNDEILQIQLGMNHTLT